MAAMRIAVSSVETLPSRCAAKPWTSTFLASLPAPSKWDAPASSSLSPEPRGKPYSDDIPQQVLQMHFDNYDMGNAPELVALQGAKKLPCYATCVSTFQSDRGHLPIASSWQPSCRVGSARCVGILPDRYQQTNLLPQNPSKQSVPTSREVLPGYFGLPIKIPMLHSLIGPAISKAQIPWLSCH